MDGVTVVTDMNEVDGMKQEDYSKDWVMHNGKSDLWFWERKMRVDERWWWEMMNECDQEAEPVSYTHLTLPTIYSV